MVGKLNFKNMQTYNNNDDDDDDIVTVSCRQTKHVRNIHNSLDRFL